MVHLKDFIVCTVDIQLLMILNLIQAFVCSHCKKSGKVRVDVVWFGEQPKHLQQIYKFLDKTEVFISIGTSNNVYPAAGFIDYILNRKEENFTLRI